MELLLPVSQPRVAQTLRDHAARKRARVTRGPYCEAMDRKIVTGARSQAQRAVPGPAVVGNRVGR